MVSLKSHNIADYVIAGVLMLSPFVFGFSDVVAARTLFLVAGVALAAYSLITDYPISIAKVIPIRTHLLMDAVVGVIILLGPAIFGYRALITDGQFAVHILEGVGALALVAMTDKTQISRKQNIIRKKPDLRRVA